MVLSYLNLRLGCQDRDCESQWQSPRYLYPSQSSSLSALSSEMEIILDRCNNARGLTYDVSSAAAQVIFAYLYSSRARCLQRVTWIMTHARTSVEARYELGEWYEKEKRGRGRRRRRRRMCVPNIMGIYEATCFYIPPIFLLAHSSPHAECVRIIVCRYRSCQNWNQAGASRGRLGTDRVVRQRERYSSSLLMMHQSTEWNR